MQEVEEMKKNSQTEAFESSEPASLGPNSKSPSMEGKEEGSLLRQEREELIPLSDEREGGQVGEKEAGGQKEGGEKGEEAETEGGLEKELNEAHLEIEKLRDSWTRERAEFMNYRKRIAQERQKQATDTVIDFLQELLPTFDNLDQVLAMEVKSEEVKKYVEGLSMIRESFIQALANRKIRTIHPMGEAFDPQSMEAIASEEDSKFTEDKVLEVYQAGYLMEGEEGQKNLIRPARVKVAKATG